MISDNAVLTVLKKSEAFSGLSEAHLSHILTIGKKIQVFDWQNTIVEGEVGSSLFVILSGGAETYQRVGDKDESMRLLGVSDVFGLKAFLLSEPRRITVKGRSDSDVIWLLEIERDDFKTIMDQYPSLLEKLTAELVKRETKNQQTLSDMNERESVQSIVDVLKTRIKMLFGKAG